MNNYMQNRIDLEKSCSLDFIRTMAILFVIFVHGLGYSGFYSESISGISMLVSEILRCLFITCVPLFLLLTGYLNNHKASKEHYLKLLRVIFIYVLCGIISQSALLVFDHNSLKKAFISFFDFSACPYAWYIEMYVGLYLLIPFLNILWDHCTLKEQKILLLCLVAIVCTPSFFSIFNFDASKF